MQFFAALRRGKKQCARTLPLPMSLAQSGIEQMREPDTCFL
jgi:hypothetical protein